MRKVLLSALMVGVVTTGAMAGTASDEFNISVTVDPYCTITDEGAAGTIEFHYNPITDEITDGDNTGKSTFTCVNGTPYTYSVPDSATLYLYGNTDSDSYITVSIETEGDSDDTATDDGNYISNGTTELSYTISVTGTHNVQVGDYIGSVTATITY